MKRGRGIRIHSQETVIDSFAEDLARAKEGDRQALEGLFQPHLSALTAFVRLRMPRDVRQRESSADVVQSVCRRAMESLEEVRAADTDVFKAWLYRVALNVLAKKLDRHHAARRDTRLEERAIDAAVHEDAVALSMSRALSPSRHAVTREEVRRIETAFERLTDDHRDVILHVGIAGLSYGETAKLMNRSEDSVRQLIHRARARLATYLDEIS